VSEGEGFKIKDVTLNWKLEGEAKLMSTLYERITTKSAIVGVIGLGYVGLPLAVEKAKAGFRVLGFDIQREKVDKINRGENYIGDVVPEDLTTLTKLHARIRNREAAGPA